MCSQARTSDEYNFQEAHVGRREPTLASCLPASMNVLCYIRPRKEMVEWGGGKGEG